MANNWINMTIEQYGQRRRYERVEGMKRGIYDGKYRNGCRISCRLYTLHISEREISRMLMD